MHPGPILMVRPNPHRLLLAITMVIAGAAGEWAAQAAAQDLIFADGFESGNLSAWNTPAPVVPSLRLADSDISLNEDVGAVEFTVTVLDQNGQEIQVDWTAAGPTATAGSDYSPSSGTLTIAGGASTAAIEILITDDLLDEPNEAFTISLSNPQNATIGQPSSTVVTIVDDDLPPVMGFEESAVTVDESLGIVVLPLNLDSPSTSDISVDYVAQPGTATEGDDFVAASGSVVISDGEVTGEIQIEIIDDPDAEYEESFTVVLQNPQGAVLGNSAVVTVTIAASDLAPVTRVTYSVGAVENIIPESESATLSISSGVATIDWSEDPHELFAGQQIVYGDPAQDAYIVSCSSVEETTTCSLAAAGGGAPPDATSQPIVEVTHAFPSVAAALAGADDADHLGTSDLAGSRVALDILCYGSGAADSEPVVIQGWTTHPETPITIRASDRDQHLGLWRDDQYRLEVTQGPCVRTSVGNVVLQGLQLNCTADPAADLSAVVFEDGATAGAALLTKLLIRLDGEIGPGDRIGVDVRDVDDLDLRIENSVILDLGTGSDRHAGMVIEGEASDVVVANTTVVGGDIGISTVAGVVTAVNTLVVGSAASCFEGTFSAQSRNNAATDFTAPGPGGRVTEAGWLVGPLTGTGSDAHLNCDPIGRSEVTHTTLENGETDRLFDNDIRVGIVTVSTDSAIVQLEFDEPLEISGTRLGLGFAWGHRWSLAAADSLSDMVTPSGSYRLLVENRPVSGEELPSPQYVWDVVSFGQPEKVKVLRLEVERVDGAGQIYIGEWQLDWPSSPCDAGADLSLDPAIAVTEDVDGEPRLAPWDIGADEGAWLVPRFVRHSYEVWEKEGTAVLDVTLARPATFDVAVGYRTRRFFAVDPQDFEETVGTVVIPAGDLDAVIAVPVVDDGEPDDGEVFKVDLIHPAGESFDGDSAEVVLRDGPPPRRVFFDQRRVTAAEGGSGAVLEVRLEEAADDDVTVHWRAEDVTALMGVDFGGAEGAALIPEGGLSAEVVVPILDDDVLTSDRLFAVRIFGATGAAVRSPSRALVTIIDDDGPAFSFSTSEYVVSESVGEAVVGVRLSLPVAEPASVDIVAEDDSAVLGEDYLTSVCTVSFAAGATDGSCVIGIVDDAMDEHDETLALALANPTGAGIGDVSAAVIVIEDDDPSPEVSFEAAAISASEGGSSATVSLVLSEPSQRSVDVEWTTVDGSAENGLDFSGGPGESHFDPGQVQALVVVPLLADFEVEGDEVFSIELTGADGATISEPSTVQVTIQDDDIAPEISIETLTPTFSEGAGSAEVVLVLSEPSNDWVEVVWFAAGGTAEDGIDYIGGYDFREIEPGGTQLTLSFPILEDTRIEDDETFVVEIDVVYGAVPVGPMTVEVTITDNDVLPEIHLTEMAVAADESAAAVQLSLEVIPSWSADASIGIVVDGGTASAGVDFELPVTRIPVPAGHSVVDFSIPLIDDTEVEPNETFSIQLVDPDGCVVIEPSVVEVTILDDDLVAVVGEPDGRVYGEGDILAMDGTGSTIPPGYESWFAVLRNDGADPMDVVHQTTELSDTFVTSEDDASYIVRLVAAAPGTLPNSVVLRGAALPCSHPVPDFGCTSAEVVINRADLKTFPFTTSYVFPEAVLLVWGGSSTPSMELERSADGGETWTAFDEPGNQDHDGGQENYTSFPDRTVEPAHTYHYRIKWNTYSEWFYLGNSFKAPGDPVTTPVWTAPRPVPTFETVDWDCPDGASPFLCLGTVSIRLDPEPGETLAGSTIRVYLNETTFEARNGAGKNVPIIWPETFPFAGRDEPGCVDRKAEPDLVVEVPEDQDSVVVDVPNAWYGANSFRFEVDDGLGGFSERALLYGIHEVLGVHHAPHKMLVPLLFGTDVTVEDFQLSWTRSGWNPQSGLC